jgi:hypothetical protein
VKNVKNSYSPTYSLEQHAINVASKRVLLISNASNQDFFALDRHQFYKFCCLYEKEYGPHARDYLKKSFNNWKSGKTKMSEEIRERFKKTMLVLQDQEKHSKQQKILSDIKIQIHQVLRFEMQVTDRKVIERNAYSDRYNLNKKNNIIATVDDVNNAFKELEKTIRSKILYKSEVILQAFTEEEIDEFNEALRFILMRKVDLSYNSVRNDFIHMQLMIRKTTLPIVLEYHVKDLDYLVKFKEGEIPDPATLCVSGLSSCEFKTKNQDLMTAVSRDCLELAKEKEACNLRGQSAVNDAWIAINNVQAGFNQEVEASVNLESEGGQIALFYRMIDQKRLRYEAAKNLWLFRGVCVVVLGLYIHAYRHDYLELLGFPVGGIIGFFILWPLWLNAKTSLQRCNEYERKY